MRSIVILTGSHLCHNPRALHSAETLARNGYRVEVLGAWTDCLLKVRDEEIVAAAPFTFTPVVDTTKHRARRTATRVRRKLGMMAAEFLNWENPWQLAYFYSELRASALARSADLYIAHYEPALAIAVELLEARKRVSVDFADWFSEDLPPDAPRQKPLRLLRSLEQAALGRSAFTSCPSWSMRQALADEYRCRAPIVIYNAFRWTDRNAIDGVHKDRRNLAIPSVHWFSQTLGPGRGLEDLLAALPRLDREIEIHLRGTPAPGFDDWLRSHIPEAWKQRMFLHPLVPSGELLSRIAEHDIGFAGELTCCRSRELTVTNKILQYLLAGLAVVASDTTGQREVCERAPGAIAYYKVGQAHALAASLNQLIRCPKALQMAKATALETARNVFSWERQEPVLLDVVAQSFSAEDANSDP
ncbi:MAG TPA: hypothetical protein VH678_05640 [Xanthobacteraceae bacterium]|jgi:glycosyltransferase involved in cell wall biosynthesis